MMTHSQRWVRLTFLCCESLKRLKKRWRLVNPLPAMRIAKETAIRNADGSVTADVEHSWLVDPPVANLQRSPFHGAVAECS